MWRTQAILSFLHEDLAGLPADDPEALRRARRRAGTMVILEWIAIVVLVALHDSGYPQLTFKGEQMIFTIGILVVAAHSGFRLAELHKLRTIARLSEEVTQRSSE